MKLDREGIQRVIPHRAPFLFVDRIVEVTNDRIVGEYDVRPDAWFFQGHFPGHPVMPGVLIVEALAQTGACLALQARAFAGRIAYFAGIERVRFRRPVTPGDTLVMEAELLWVRGRLGRLSGRVSVAGELVADGELTFAVPDAEVEGGDG